MQAIRILFICLCITLSTIRITSADFCPPDSLQSSNMRDIMLCYLGNDDWKQADFEPYVAWLDRSQGNKPADWFYDSWLFLMFGGAPSGGAYFNGTATKTDWDFYFDLLFKPDQNLAALEACLTEIGEKLNDPNRVCPVMIMIPYLDAGFENFGDVDGDGANEDLENETDRIKCYKWAMDETLRRYDPAKYPHLKLWGFYWMMEGVNPSEETLVREIADYCHAAGFGFHWIPWYVAPGYDRWEECGFDFIIMQPNYAFMPVPRGAVVADEGRLTNNAILCRRNNLGYEMELDYQPHIDPGQRIELQLYLNHGVDELDGYMNGAVRAYYQGTDCIAKLYESPLPECNRLYDDLYRFHKGTYQRRVISLCEGATATVARQVTPKLTDGIWMTQGTRHQDRIISGKAPLVSEINLGATQMVGDVRVHIVAGGPQNLSIPGSVAVDCSLDGKAWEECEPIACPPLFTDEGWNTGFAHLIFEPRLARYLRVTLQSSSDNLVALDEVVIMPAAHALWGMSYSLTGKLSEKCRIETGCELTDGRLMIDENAAGGLQFEGRAGGVNIPLKAPWAVAQVLAHARWNLAGEIPHCRLTSSLEGQLQTGDWVTGSGAGEQWLVLNLPQQMTDEIHLEFAGAGVWWDEVQVKMAPNLTLNKPYQLTPEFTAIYPDSNNSELTDGVLTQEGYSDSKTVGWSNTGVEVTLDLKQQTAIDTVRLHMQGGGIAGINFPDAIDVRVSMDGNRWKRVETGKPEIEPTFATPAGEDTNELSWYNLHFPPIQTKFIKVLLSGPGYWIMLSEIEALAEGENLAQGCHYQLKPFPTSNEKYADKGGSLTDGECTRAGDWSKIAGWSGANPEIIVDLMQPQEVALVRAHVLGGGEAGIWFPEKFSVATSLDGINWSEDTSTEKFPEESGNEGLVAFTQVKLTLREARYLRLRFETRGWFMLSEIEAMGT